MGHALQDVVDADYRPFATHEPAFAYAHDLGRVSSASVTYAIGSIQQPSMRYLTSTGVVHLQPWWMKCYGDIFQMISFYYNDLAETQSLAAQFEAQLHEDVDLYYSANMAMVKNNDAPSTPPVWSNGSISHNETDQFSSRYFQSMFFHFQTYLGEIRYGAEKD